MCSRLERRPGSCRESRSGIAWDGKHELEVILSLSLQLVSKEFLGVRRRSKSGQRAGQSRQEGQGEVNGEMRQCSTEYGVVEGKE